MDSTAGLYASSRTSFALAGIALLAGCGSVSANPTVDAAGVDAPAWPAEATFSSCEQYASLSVGNYNIQSDYWNQTTCPGTQCIEINKETGAFSVTQGAAPCGDKVSSYPNVLYGCSYGNCSPGTILPLPVSAVSALTSNWDFSVGGSASDRWNVAVEMWFCPDNNCAASGFPGGLELMVWLDYKNARGFKDHRGTVKLGGYDWDVWEADPGILAAGSAIESWTYMDYIIKGQMVTSVTNLDLKAIIQDAVNRGYAQNSWYLYGIQAGAELRVGGIPFTSNSFSVSINGVTPSAAALPDAGLSCAAEPPTADGQLAVSDSYVTVGPLHGYGASWTNLDPNSPATICATPVCTGGQEGAAGTCSPSFGPSALCIGGAVSADTTYHATAGLGFMLNQDLLVDGGATGADGGTIPPIGTITIPNSITVTVAKSGGSLQGNSYLRVQLTDVDGNRFCHAVALDAPIPIGQFNTACWNNTGAAATSSTAFTRVDVIVPSSAASEEDFAFCITNVSVQ